MKVAFQSRKGKTYRQRTRENVAVKFVLIITLSHRLPVQNAFNMSLTEYLGKGWNRFNGPLRVNTLAMQNRYEIDPG